MGGNYGNGTEHFAARARREGYAARSVYKLAEMDERYGLLRPGMRVLDVGAAPGSWSQYALSRVGPDGFVIGVDPTPLFIAAPNFRFIQGSIFDEVVHSDASAGGRFHLLMSDAAPRTTGSRIVDTGRSEALVAAVVGLCDSLLAPGGALVVKIFQGGGEQPLLADLRGRFERAKFCRPKATRRNSFETYCVGLGFLPSGRTA